MILVCPECHTRYTIPNAVFGDSGRMFRCSACRHMWFHRVNETPASEPVVEEAFTFMEPPVKEIPPSRAAPAKMFSGPVRRQIPPVIAAAMSGQGGTKSLQALCIFLLVLIIVLYPIAYRKTIIHDHPMLALVYELVGIYDASGLKISDIKMTKEPAGDKRFQVTLDCAVVNQAQDSRYLPSLYVTLIDAKGSAVAAASGENIIQTGKKIHAGESIPCKKFTFSMGEKDADRIRLDLADELDMALSHK